MWKMGSKRRLLPHQAPLTPTHSTGYFKNIEFSIVEMCARCHFVVVPISAIAHYANRASQEPACNAQGSDAHIRVFHAMSVGVGHRYRVDNHAYALVIVRATLHAKNSCDVT